MDALRVGVRSLETRRNQKDAQSVRNLTKDNEMNQILKCLRTSGQGRPGSVLPPQGLAP